MNKFVMTAAAACFALGSAAHAATVTFTDVTTNVAGAYQGLYDGFLPGIAKVSDDFAGAATPAGDATGVPAAVARTDGNSITTSVGTFAGLSGTGTGDSVTGDPTEIQIRSGNNAGRFNVLNADGNFLDSNDTTGFTWTIDNLDGLIRGVSAFITDPNDASRELTVSLFNGVTQIFNEVASVSGDRDNSTVWQLTADFTGEVWTQAIFKFEMDGTNDGIGLSNAALSTVPVPAGGLLLLTGLGALAMRRRRKAA